MTITKRWPPGVTKRFEENVTKRYEEHSESHNDQAPWLVASALRVDEWVVDRYRIEAGPLGFASGEAEVFRCWDEQSNKRVALKLYRHHNAPKEAVLKQLHGLSHPNIVRLQDYGFWQGRIYEVMEYCQGGTWADTMPFSEAKLESYVPALLNGLHYCHQRGIIHRDIKPNNLFFRFPEEKEPVLGDFGISSMLEQGPSQVQITQTAANLTLEYAAPELLDSHQVFAKTDFYALGITFLHLLTGVSPFQGMAPTHILVAHLQGRIAIPEHISPKWQELLRGLLQYDAANRWGFSQVIAWQKGDVVLTDNKVIWRDNKRQQAVQYAGFPAAKTPQELALHLQQFDAESQLFRGDIRRWVFDNFDSDLADKIATIEREFHNRQAQGVIKLTYLLNPDLPLRIAEHEIDSLSKLADILENRNKLVQEALQEAFNNEWIDAWIEAGRVTPQRDALLVKMRSIRQRLRYNQDRQRPLLALLFSLDPARPLALTNNIAVHHPREIEKYINQHKALSTRWIQLLYSGCLEEWVRAAEFPGWEKDVAYLKECRTVYMEDKTLGGYALRWYYHPNVHFPFSGKEVSNPAALVNAIDQDENSRQKGLALLQRGWIRAWLVHSGRLRNVSAFDSLVGGNACWEEKLEAVLHLLDPNLAKPELAITRMHFSLGVIAPDPRLVSLQISNKGRGFLSGEIVPQTQDIALNNYLVRGKAVDLQVTLNPLGVPNIPSRGIVRVITNGGNADVSISYRIQLDEDGASLSEVVGHLRFGMVRWAFLGLTVAWILMILISGP